MCATMAVVTPVTAVTGTCSNGEIVTGGKLNREAEGKRKSGQKGRKMGQESKEKKGRRGKGEEEEEGEEGEAAMSFWPHGSFLMENLHSGSH